MKGALNKHCFLDWELALVLIALASAWQVPQHPVDFWPDEEIRYDFEANRSLEITYLNSRCRPAGVYRVDFRHHPALLDLTLNGRTSCACCGFTLQGRLRISDEILESGQRPRGVRGRARTGSKPPNKVRRSW